jgi:protoheme IX farnesyltransferase
MTTGAVTAAPAAWRDLALDYVRLTKPRVISLLLVVTVGAMMVAADGLPDLVTLAATVAGGYLAAGGAHSINQFADRDLDRHMTRTDGRPVVNGRVSPTGALVFGIALGLASFLLLGLVVNWLAAALAMAGLVLYVGLYTAWLKRTTVHNIVIGGAAGAVPPLVGWAAVTGELSLTAWLMFAIVFYWTPPHFWALALMLERDYARAGVPMLPVVRGERETRRQIVLWTLVMIGVSLLPTVSGAAGMGYLVAALIGGGVMLALALRLDREGARWARPTFSYSLLYLVIIFVALGVDAA